MIRVVSSRVYELEVPVTEEVTDVQISFKRDDDSRGDDSNLNTIFAHTVNSVFMARTNFHGSGDIYGDLVAAESTVKVDGKMTLSPLSTAPEDSMALPQVDDFFDSTPLLLLRFRTPGRIQFTEGDPGRSKHVLRMHFIDLHGVARTCNKTFTGNNVRMTVYGDVATVCADSANIIGCGDIAGSVEAIKTFMRVKGHVHGITTIVAGKRIDCSDDSNK
jgi:hypothetical protein